MTIVSNIRAVDKAILSVDEDRTVCATLKKISQEYGSEYELSFANGGDQNNDTIPERSVCEEMGISLIDGLGDKIQSSSWLLNKS
jgi:D-beta-D-heptose 7-phosphate kinase/D-beta-D-heptose 1-phosphate adenosyltransferase